MLGQILRHYILQRRSTGKSTKGPNRSCPTCHNKKSTRKLSPPPHQAAGHKRFQAPSNSLRWYAVVTSVASRLARPRWERHPRNGMHISPVYSGLTNEVKQIPTGGDIVPK